MSDAHRKASLEGTRPAAAALLEDLQHIREILNLTTPSPGPIRRLSVTLRRLLVNREITIIAAPRMGKFHFQAPNNRSYYKLSGNLVFFSSGAFTPSAPNFSPRLSLYLTNRLPTNPEFSNWSTPSDLIPLSLDGFLGQKILYLHGKWLNRREVIKYVTIVASGAHSNTPSNEHERLLAAISNGVKIKHIAKDEYAVDFIGRFGFDKHIQPFRYMPNAIDPVLAELAAAAAFTVDSEDTKKLEALVREELR